MRALFKTFGLLWMSHVASAGVIYGVDQIPARSRQVHYLMAVTRIIYSILWGRYKELL